MDNYRIAFLAAFRILRPGAEEIVMPLIREAKKAISKLGELLSWEPVLTTPQEGRKAVNELLTQEPDIFVAFVAGGTEEIIYPAFRDINHPLVILACDRANSLAAALEMLSRFREMGKDVKLIYETHYGDSTAKAILDFLIPRKAVKKLRATAIGVLGSPSPWLIGCTSNYHLLEDKFGLTVKRMDLLALYQEYQGIPSSAAETVAQEILGETKGLKEPSHHALVEAVKLYLAVRNIVEREGLKAITVRCFDIIPLLDNTLCLALSRLNDEGIIAGCEGDINALLSMLILHYLTGQPTWMANPVSVDYERNTLTLAHCTAPMKIFCDPGKVVLRSHFESGKGVAVQGPFAEGEITLIRLGGSRLDKLMIGSGEIARSDMGYDYMCRTQVEVRLKGPVGGFLEKSLGNHLALVPGKVSGYLLELSQLLGVEPVLID